MARSKRLSGPTQGGTAIRRLVAIILILATGLCADRAASAATGGKARATFTAVIHSTDHIVRCSIGASPWSPRANVLALASSQGLTLLDMDAVPPRRRLLCARVEQTQYTIAWAADGQKMACHAHLVGAVPVRPGAPDDSLVLDKRMFRSGYSRP